VLLLLILCMKNSMRSLIHRFFSCQPCHGSLSGAGEVAPVEPVASQPFELSQPQLDTSRCQQVFGPEVAVEDGVVARLSTGGSLLHGEVYQDGKGGQGTVDAPDLRGLSSVAKRQRHCSLPLAFDENSSARNSTSEYCNRVSKKARMAKPVAPHVSWPSLGSDEWLRDDHVRVEFHESLS